jgi:hypothetical protein
MIYIPLRSLLPVHEAGDIDLFLDVIEITKSHTSVCGDV